MSSGAKGIARFPVSLQENENSLPSVGELSGLGSAWHLTPTDKMLLERGSSVHWAADLSSSFLLPTHRS